MSKWWGMWFVYRSLTDGERGNLWWPALSLILIVLYRCWLYLLGMKLLISGTLFLNRSTSLGWICPRTILMKNGLLHRTFSIWDLHTILRIISRGFPGFRTYYPCGVWGRGWGTCLLYDDPIFGLFNSQLLLKFDIVWRDFSFDFLLYSYFIHYPSFAHYFPLD